MDKSSADAFVYAKASGMLAKSFVGSRATKLFSTTSLQGLWELLFQSEVPLVSEASLVQMIEREAERCFLRDFTSLIKKYSKPQEFIVDLLRFYDYNSLKTILASINSNEVQGKELLPLHLAFVGKFAMLDYRKWPSLVAMTAGTSLSWCVDAKETMGQQEMEMRLDAQYIRSLWRSASRLDAMSREPVCSLLKEEIVFGNIVWGLRLRLYYGMAVEDVLGQLTTLNECRSTVAIRKDEWVRPVVEILSLPLDSYRDWEGWRYCHLLNPQEDGVDWLVDPRWIQRMARIELFRRSLRQFHRHPFTAHVLFCWFKVKQYELDCIRMVAEGIRLKVSPAQVGKFAGIEVF